MTNFIDDVIDGKTKLDEIDDYVEKWHNSDSHCSVSEYLGMTEEEYFLWTEDNSNLKYIVPVSYTHLTLPTNREV
mgnify:CR=1 FL=1